MKAVFLHKDCVLRDSHIDPHNVLEAWHLTPATLEAMRLLATEERLVFLFGACIPQGDGGKAAPDLESLVKQIEAGGGRVDGLISCEHDDAAACKCWGESAGALWTIAARFNLHLNECYVLGDTEQDTVAACAAGARPLLVLCNRTIGQVLGNLPRHKDFPIALDLTQAVSYIGVEEEINRQLGHTRAPAVPRPADGPLDLDPKVLPTVQLTSALAQSLQIQMHKTRAELRDIVRWLSFFVLGALGLSLGIAYMLTHLYRVQPFPAFVYYITLQFISRPLRGALFIAIGAGVIVLAMRSFYRSSVTKLFRRGA
jgi:D-glycero-D-manno-heptose 1,7-bisphosphate phosphatase